MTDLTLSRVRARVARAGAATAAAAGGEAVAGPRHAGGAGRGARERAGRVREPGRRPPRGPARACLPTPADRACGRRGGGGSRGPAVRGDGEGAEPGKAGRRVREA